MADSDLVKGYRGPIHARLVTVRLGPRLRLAGRGARGQHPGEPEQLRRLATGRPGIMIPAQSDYP